jgi:hypothetical protein
MHWSVSNLPNRLGHDVLYVMYNSFPSFQPEQGNTIPLINIPLAGLIVFHHFWIKVFLQQPKESLVRLYNQHPLSHTWLEGTNLSAFLPAKEDLDIFAKWSQVT